MHKSPDGVRMPVTSIYGVVERVLRDDGSREGGKVFNLEPCKTFESIQRSVRVLQYVFVGEGFRHPFRPK
jgi:hypothetical protein